MPSIAQFKFQDGALHLTPPSGGEVRLQWTPIPGVHLRLANGRWHRFVPDFRILAPAIPLPDGLPEAETARLRSKQEAFQAFRALLPEDIVRAVEPFTCHQWVMITLLYRSGAARELARTNPVLAYALANSEHLREGAGREQAAVDGLRTSRLKQRDIAAWLGFPGTEAMVRILKKIPPGIVYPALLRKLSQCMAIPEVVKLFGHLPVLNTGVIFLASHPETAAVLTSGLLRDVVAAPGERMAAPTADTLFELLAYAHKIGSCVQLGPIGNQRSVEVWQRRLIQIRQQNIDRIAQQDRILTEMRRLSAPRLHREHVDEIERLREDYNRLEAQRRDEPPRFIATSAETRRQKELIKLAALTFPPPPIPGTATIVPLQSFVELEKESVSQGNCVGLGGAYATRVVSGEMYIYKVLAPSRHTLAIVRRGGSWQIGEIKRHGNTQPREDALLAVQSWLGANQMSL